MVTNNIVKPNKPTIKPNKCFYCGNEIKGTRRYFCSNTCLQKYWSGVYSKKWKEGDIFVREDDKPTEQDIEKEKQKYQARRLAYKKLNSKKIINCDLCGIKLKKSKIVRHHEDYNKPEIFMVLCTKCHGWVKRYNNLKKKLYFDELKGGVVKNADK